MIIVTGAAGFIGSHIAKSIKGNVLLCDPADTSMIQPEFLEKTIYSFHNIDAIFHLGAISSTTEDNIGNLTKNNILLGSTLLDICIEREIPFIYSSSASVYGIGIHGFKENAHHSPLNYYSISKASFDMYVLQKIIDNPLSKIIGLRYFNVYGNNEDHKGDMASPVHKFLKQARELGEIKVFEGSETFLRDFIHVDDVVNITLASGRFKNSGIYNVGTGIPRSFMDVASIISKETNSKVIKIPFPEHLLGKYQKFTCSDNAKIDLAGYSSKRISLEQGIKKVMNGQG